MLQLVRDGGYPMWLILAMGSLTLCVAAYGTMRTDPRVLGFLTWMIAALSFASLAGVAADVGTTLHHAASGPDGLATRVLVQGLAESTRPAIVGFAFAAMIAMLGAIVRRRAGT